MNTALNFQRDVFCSFIFFGKVCHATKVMIEEYDEYGRKFIRGARSLFANIF